MGSVKNLIARAKEREPVCRKQGQVHRGISKAADKGTGGMLGAALLRRHGPQHDPVGCVSCDVLSGCGSASSLQASVLLARSSQRMQIPFCNSLEDLVRKPTHSAKKPNNACEVWQCGPRLLCKEKREQAIVQLKLQYAATL